MKNLKRILCVLLASLMIFGLFSCKKDEETEDTAADTGVEEPAVEDISFLDYSLIRPEKSSQTLIGEIGNMYALMMSLSGKQNVYETDTLPKGKEPDPEAKEILVGLTNRPESAEAFAQISGNEFIVAVIGNKIVITGITDNATIMGVRYFIETYLTADSTGMIAGDLCYKAEAEVVSLTEDGQLKYSLVYASNDIAAYQAVNKVGNTLRAMSGSPVQKVTTDKATDDENAYQILVGYTDFALTEAVEDKTTPEGYTIDFVGNNIVIFAWTSSSLMTATEKFIDLISNSFYVDDSGNTTICLMKEEMSSDKGVSTFYKDVPFEAKGEEAQRIYDAGDDTMMLYWKGVTAESFTDYSNKIKALDYATYQTNENTSIKSVTYTKGDVMVHVYYYTRLSELRVVVSKGLEFVTNPYTYTKVCEPAFTMIGGLEHKNWSVGASFLIRLEDGTFIIIDGGYSLDYNVKELYRLMEQQKPSVVEDIIVTAWIISHPHGDHTDMYQYYSTSEYKDKFTLKYLIGSDFSDFYTTVVDDKGRHFTYEEFASRMPGCKYVKMHAGQNFYFPGVTIETLFTHEDIAPGFMYELNNMLDTIFMVTINGNDTRDPYKFLMINDFTKEGSDAAAATWGNELKCDVVLLGHHTSGGSVALYEFADAPLCLCTDHERGYTEGWGHDNPAVIWAKENMEWILAYEGHYTFWFEDQLEFSGTGSVDEDGSYTKLY